MHSAYATAAASTAITMPIMSGFVSTRGQGGGCRLRRFFPGPARR